MKFLPMSRRRLYSLWCMAWFTGIISLIQPIGNGITRSMAVGAIISIWIGGIYLCWQRRNLRIISLGLSLMLSIFLLAPERPVLAESLRQEYLQALQGYQGTTYVWGGENHRGIDCSGLVREGLVQANLVYGLKSFNPGLVRRGLTMWWFDLSAISLRDGARGWTKKLLESKSINGVDRAQLLPGDLAATADGVHIMAYLGNSKWIEADPGILKVIVVTVPEPNNSWFEVPVHVLRWQQLIA